MIRLWLPFVVGAATFAAIVVASAALSRPILTLVVDIPLPPAEARAPLVTEVRQ